MSIISIKPIPLATIKAAFIRQVDTDVDALIGKVIGNRASEYEMAEGEATAYKAAGYPVTPVPSSVASWASAKGWTNAQAADSILAASTSWRNAQAAMRAKRLGLKEAAKVAIDGPALDVIKAQWLAFMSVMKTQLGA